MKRKSVAWFAVLVLLTAGSRGRAATDPASAEAALAARLSEMAQNTLRAPRIVDASWRSAAALLRGASRLDPDEPRYPRLLLEAQLRLGATDDAIDTARRLLALEPANQVAQVRMIELYLSRMQTADARIGYLRDLLGKPAIPAEVRSQVAVRIAALLGEQAQPEAALDMLSQALRLNALNPQALALRYQMVRENGPLERVSVLLDMLQSNPAQPTVMAELAEELAAVGLVQPALQWYGRTLSLSPRMGVPVSRRTAAGYAAELLLGDQSAAAGALIGQMLQADPTDPDAWMLRLVQEKSEKNLNYAKSLEEAQKALLQRLEQVRQAFAAQTGTTRPADDLTAELEQVRQTAAPELLAAYRSALTDLTWFELYFNEKPAVARQYLRPLAALSPSDSVTVARLEGWAYLLEGKPAEARTKLSAVRDRDPLAALGMLRADGDDPATRDQNASLGRKLLSENPSTLVGAILYGALREQGARIVPSDHAEAIQERLGAFPVDWLGILEKPEAFYALRAEPLQVAHQYGEPMLARITVANLGNYPLTVGDEGIVRPDLWIDASLRGMAQQQLPGVAYDRLSKVLVLQPRQQVSQIVRVDQGVLADLLAANPAIAIQVFASVMTNPITSGQSMLSGPGGYQARFSRMLERSGSPLNSEQTKRQIVAQAGGDASGARLRALQLVAAYLQIYAQQNDERFVGVLHDLRGSLKQAMDAPAPLVEAWARYLDAAVSDAADRESAVRRMLNSNQWTQRLLGLVAAGALPPATQQQLAGPVAAADADAVVQAYAQAALALAEVAATQPTTQPAGR